MQMILKSMGVKVDKDDMENYAGEVGTELEQRGKEQGHWGTELGHREAGAGM